MKYLVMLGDGMADLNLTQLNGKTPLDVANKPHMDFLAKHGDTGLVKTVPDGMNPGSDTANLSVMGYDPRKFYTGRSPLEAVSMGIGLKPEDIALRCNLVTLSDTELFSDSVMVDYSAGEITTEESTQLIEAVSKTLNDKFIDLYAGISYRHCLVLRNNSIGTQCTPPHDITGKPIKDKLPTGKNAALLLQIMEASRETLRNHPVNLSRVAKRLNPANSCWFWGEGTSPSLTSFYEKYGLMGGVVSAVDLIKGIGICAGLKVFDVVGATGNLHTNFKGKAQAALDLFSSGCDFVYLHIEAPDECGHQGDVAGKIKAIELIDSEVLGPILHALNTSNNDYSVLLLPDHPTPLELKTHTSDPVPFTLYRSTATPLHASEGYSESLAAKTGLYVAEGHTLIDTLIAGKGW